ncbi:glycosyl hydrolase family 17 [Pseudotenacibaculum sp. MALMAid0570]|uniref:glycosyl hydrolase family 17 n=1 Tax=Pseudotenacibaculum sp. MALMAid0570 TaxID=3143938 RepID=UPI0032DEDD77
MKQKVYLLAFISSIFMWSCDSTKTKERSQVTAKDILGNPEYQAISYGGYRKTSRDFQPTIAELKEDMKILQALNIKVLRTYNVQLAQASNLLKAITELKAEDSTFEMYVMLGAWIDCKNAWTNQAPDHEAESEQNEGEIARAVALANEYPDIVKIIAVGNEAMVKWAASYYVQPRVILKWVNHLQNLKKEGKLPKDLWITSSDDFSSWGGGDKSYHVKDLEDLIKAVDYISMHTYAYHNSHYNPEFWQSPEEDKDLTNQEKIDTAMLRAKKFAMNQYNAVSDYMKSLGVNKPVHIGETGWATVSNGLYGPTGSRATDEYKEAAYYNHLREWTNEAGISCFYFEAFDEPWKDAHNSEGSENHFGLITVDGKAKFALWKEVDKGTFKGLKRNGNPITKTFNGNKDSLMIGVLTPPEKKEVSLTH